MARYEQSEPTNYEHGLSPDMRMERMKQVIREDVVYIHQIGYVELPRCKETAVEK